MFNVRAVVLDHYISKSISELYDKNDCNFNSHWLEPVIRIYGSTPNGIKSCVHVHGVYPYIYVPCKGGDTPDRDALILGAALEEALKVAYSQRNTRYVVKVTVTSGIPLYGYHSSLRQFFKVFFYNPYHIRKASELLLNGVILGQKLQPHEAHIPYVLQFMMDYNIYGMSFVGFKKIKYRRNPENPESLVGINEEEILSSDVKRMTHCYVEVDALAIDITNRENVRGLRANPGLQGIWESEKIRRREQNRTSQFTVEQTQPRKYEKIQPAEAMYKERLAAKLREIPVKKAEVITSVDSDELKLTYPAVVSEEQNLLEASVLDDGLRPPQPELDELLDVSVLISEKILSQIEKEDGEDGENAEDVDGAEAESILGKIQQEGEAEAELEEDDGGDMTQPLEAEEDGWTNTQVDGSEREDFWKSMAERILQVDGTQDSSSDSETGVTGNPRTAAIDSMSNLLSTLNDNNSVGPNSLPFIVSQAPPTCLSPRIDCSWLTQNSEAWSWDKNEIIFTDFFSPKTQSIDFPNALTCKPTDDGNSCESLGNLFTSSYQFDGYTTTSELTPCTNLETGYSDSSPLTILPPSNRYDCYSDINMNLIQETTVDMCKIASDFKEGQNSLEHPQSEVKTTSAATESLRKNPEKSPKNSINGKTPSAATISRKPISLTLKQYLKDIGEIISVDLKNFNDHQMVVIEYRPVNSKTGPNKFLIKPLDKFLENWNIEEKRMNEELDGKNRKEQRTKFKGESKRFDSSTPLSSNKQLADEFNCSASELKENLLNFKSNLNNNTRVNKSKCDAVPGRCTGAKGSPVKNCVSHKESDSGSHEIEKCTRKCTKAKYTRNKESNERKSTKSRCERLVVNNLSRPRGQVKKNESELNGGPEVDADLSKTEMNVDVKLINEINSCFEDYFKSIVKVNNTGAEKNTNNLLRSQKATAVEKDGQLPNGPTCDDTCKEKSSNFPKTFESENLNSLKFVAQLLSVFSNMSQTCEIPPLSITINIGNQHRTNSDSAPVQLNLQPTMKGKTEREVKPKSNKVKKSFKIQNVDGPADCSSSSEESIESPTEPHRKKPNRESKRDWHYKSLDVKLQKSVKKERKRKRSGVSNTDDEDTNTSVRRDTHGVHSEIQLRSKIGRIAKSRTETKSSEKSFGKAESSVAGPSGVTKPTEKDAKETLTQEPDIIYDSDDGMSFKIATSRRKRRKLLKFKSKTFSRKILEGDTSVTKPREDTEHSSSSSGVIAGSSNDVPSSLRKTNQYEKPTEELEASFSSLDRTIYKIPCKWRTSDDQVKSSEGNQRVEPENLTERTESQDLIKVTSLSPSSLCSPPQNVALSSPSSKCTTSQTLLGCFDVPENELSSFDSKFNFTESEWYPSTETISLTESKLVIPKLKPPSYRDVQSFLVTNENIKETKQEPFYSDHRDVTKAKEVGPLVLKVETTACPGLKTFRSSIDLRGTEERRAQLLKTDRPAKVNFRYFLIPDKDKTIVPLMKPPSSSEVLSWLNLKKNSPDNEGEVKTKTKVFLPASPGQESHSEEEFDVSLSMSTVKGSDPQAEDAKDVSSTVSSQGSQQIISEPNRSNADLFLKSTKQCADNSFQIKGPTLQNTYGFDTSVQNLQEVKLSHTHQYITMLVVEVHVQTREDFRPDPKLDPIKAIFYMVTFDSPNKNQETGLIVVNDSPLLLGEVPRGAVVHRAPTEVDSILKLVELMKVWDPDILAGYEIEMHSWGYLVQRGFMLELNLISLLGRVQVDNSDSRKTKKSAEREMEDLESNVRNMRISGRIMLDIWRVLRHEIALTSYTFENVMYHLSHERHPYISYKELSFYWERSTPKCRHLTVSYYLTRVTGIIRILDHLDFINRTSEFARLFGIQFYEVLSRGSQFRVESMMLRMAKPLNYVPVSPSVAQRADMRAPGSLPLILEPESTFYTDPVIVLDFQSLYPSIIIGYNYCFSTCLGRMENLGGANPFEFGCTQLQISPEELKNLENDITISPAGIVFVKPNIRRGILPVMLEEILETRLMVKKSMKYNKSNKLLQKVLHAQQLGLKLIANVTYGYTAANFSGRMPCIEVGDSVVSKGRETLHRAIQLVKNNNKWGARVVYGDTDSIFVLTPGKTRAEAFKIGAEIAEAVTQDNPKPVKLKLEKVYQPCILQTKKRYVGYMYESPDQQKPVFEAKGIETVRRDGCPAVGKILQKALEILFDTRDVSLVKKYTIRQFSKILQGNINMQDLIYAKEYKGRHGYRPGACVPALELAKCWTRYDRQAEPRVKERVPYVIVSGPPGVPLIKLVRSPTDLLADPSLHINTFYYITKAIIPPLHRCFSLIGVDVASWYKDMPKKFKKTFKSVGGSDVKKSTISQYFKTVNCILCSEFTSTPLCQKCQKRPQATAVGLLEKVRLWEKSRDQIAKICQSCCKFPKEFDCQSLDCPVLFRKTQASRNFSQVSFLRELLDECLETSSGRPRESNVTASTSAEGTSEDVKDAFYDISPRKECLGMEFLEDFKHF